jgi:hypothetical protein
VQSESRSAAADGTAFNIVRAAFLRSARTYGDLGSPLYAALFAGAAEDPEIVAMACHAQAGANPAIHLLVCVHFLLLREPGDPLARFYATLTDAPAPPEQAFSDFARFCRTHRSEILHLLATRTVQSTYVERCGILLPLVSAVADEAGEPLNLIEIGCSAAVLLTFDKYAYRLPDGTAIGAPDAPLEVACVVHDGPRPRIPAIDARIGLDLHPIDARDPEERQWLIAASLPELRSQREALITALDVVAASDIRMLKGDALDLIADVLGQTPGPVCVFHSACLSYWPQHTRDALDARLCEASRTRTIYRVGIEASANFYAWHQGLNDQSDRPQASVPSTSELVTVRYRKGTMTSSVVGEGPIFGPFNWVGSPAWA